MLKASSHESSLMYILLIIFIITEIVDDTLDRLLGSSFLHSGIQLILFIMLFFAVTKLFMGYYRKRIDRLIPQELMSVLKAIKESEDRGVVLNQRDIGRRLGITKPTLKKRIDSLLSLNYVSFEREGNNKYLKITPLGSSIM